MAKKEDNSPGAKSKQRARHRKLGHGSVTDAEHASNERTKREQRERDDFSAGDAEFRKNYKYFSVGVDADGNPLTPEEIADFKEEEKKRLEMLDWQPLPELIGQRGTVDVLGEEGERLRVPASRAPSASVAPGGGPAAPGGGGRTPSAASGTATQTTSTGPWENTTTTNIGYDQATATVDDFAGRIQLPEHERLRRSQAAAINALTYGSPYATMSRPGGAFAPTREARQIAGGMVGQAIPTDGPTAGSSAPLFGPGGGFTREDPLDIPTGPQTRTEDEDKFWAQWAEDQSDTLAEMGRVQRERPASETDVEEHKKKLYSTPEDTRSRSRKGTD